MSVNTSMGIESEFWSENKDGLELGNGGVD